jgi:uncharacterized repeat protein (TIGR01451 family)
MNGNQLDTTCSALLISKGVSLDNLNISDLTGISYFDSLERIDCDFNNLTTFPRLPESLLELDCQDNNLTSLPDLPPNLFNLKVMNNNLTSLPANLPLTLTTLNCGNNLISALPPLPNGLKRLAYFGNSISSISVLPDSLYSLDCSLNNITSLPSFPNTLTYINCLNNLLTSLPALPESLISLDCRYNLLDSLPILPNGIERLYCSDNLLTNLPILPSSLSTLHCRDNQISVLPDLPKVLNTLYCSNNLLTSLPKLPWKLRRLDAQNNLLTSIQKFPAKFDNLNISNNPQLYCLPPVNTIDNFTWNNTGIICLPNKVQISISTPSALNLPVCDFINYYNCPVNWNIKGIVYSDADSNCVYSPNEILLEKIKVNIFRNGSLVKQTITNSMGEYFFKVDTGTYTYSVDTLAIPFTVNCPDTFIHSSTLNSNLLFHENKDFSLQCKQNIDLGVSEVRMISGVPRPGANVPIAISAGDMASAYNLQCATGISGTVKVIIQGPAIFSSVLSGALVPNVSGDTLTYAISDFGNVNFTSDFMFTVSIDTLSLLGDQICFHVEVSPVIGDIQPLNNSLIHCYEVVNSFDPNDKAVHPIGDIDTSQLDLTYTIRFQNTGNAPALHVRIVDTLSQHINERTFQLLSSSHDPQIQINGKNVFFNFHNINLPDSVNNEPDSHGYIQYTELKEKATSPSALKFTTPLIFILILIRLCKPILPLIPLQCQAQLECKSL